MGSAGFEVSIQDGGLFSSPGDQKDRYDEVFSTCVEWSHELGIVHPPRPFSEDQLRAFYDAHLWTHGCLLAEGYPVTEPPSLEVFMSSDPRWHPYDAVAAGTDVTEIESVCPQDIPTVLMIIVDRGGG